MAVKYNPDIDYQIETVKDTIKTKNIGWIVKEFQTLLSSIKDKNHVCALLDINSEENFKYDFLTLNGLADLMNGIIHKPTKKLEFQDDTIDIAETAIEILTSKFKEYNMAEDLEQHIVGQIRDVKELNGFYITAEVLEDLINNKTNEPLNLTDSKYIANELVTALIAHYRSIAKDTVKPEMLFQRGYAAEKMNQFVARYGKSIEPRLKLMADRVALYLNEMVRDAKAMSGRIPYIVTLAYINHFHSGEHADKAGAIIQNETAVTELANYNRSLSGMVEEKHFTQLPLIWSR